MNPTVKNLLVGALAVGAILGGVTLLPEAERPDNTAYFIRVAVKIGSPGNKWKSFREGYPGDWRIVLKDTLTGKVVSGEGSFGTIGDKAYLPLDITYHTDTLDSVKAWVRPHVEYKPNGDIDTSKSRTRSAILSLESIATAAFKTAKAQDSAIADWRATTKPLKPITLKTGPPRIDPLTVAVAELPAAADKHSVSSGSYDIGTGGDYSTFALGHADIANLTGNLRFEGVSDVTETASATITEDLGGFTFTCTVGDANWHHGNTARGYLITVAHGDQQFYNQAEGPGTYELTRIRCVRQTVGGGGRYFYMHQNVGAELTSKVHHNIFDGAGLDCKGMLGIDATVIWHCYANVVYDAVGEGIYCYAMNAGDVIEDNTVYGCGTGIDCNNKSVGVLRRNACYANTTDFNQIGNATGYSNASDDATAADGNWGTGASNISARSTADFVSVDTSSANYLMPVRGGALQDPDTTTALAANTADLGGNLWATYGWWIGARANTIATGTSLRDNYYGRARARGRGR